MEATGVIRHAIDLIDPDLSGVADGATAPEISAFGGRLDVDLDVYVRGRAWMGAFG